MTTIRQPNSAANGTESADVTLRSAEPSVQTLQSGAKANEPSYFPNVSQIRPADARSEPEAVNGNEYDSAKDINKLAFKRDPPVARGPYYSTQVDVVAVPAIGGHPEKTWASKTVFSPEEPGATSTPSEIQKAIIKSIPMSPGYSSPPAVTITNTPRAGGDMTEPAWITRGIRARANEARVLLYDHGVPKEEDTLKSLATRLLKNIEDLRRIENSTRPIFFICHSTGGLVVKMALTEGHRSRSTIIGDCYGVTFFATPHRGSSHLARLDFAQNIKNIMRLSAPLPESISRQLHLDSALLVQLDADFKKIATELRIWTFFETEDTNLTTEYHAPITSIKSALLNLRHEVVYPLLSDHAASAGFGSKNSQTRESYLGELAAAIEKALEYSTIKHTEMNIDGRVQVEVIGFYEMADSVEVPIEVWSTSRSLKDFRKHGPAKLLKDRLSEINSPPRERQHLRQNTRAPTLLHDKRRDAGPAVPIFKSDSFDIVSKTSDPELRSRSSRFLRSRSRSRSRDRSSQEAKISQHLLSPKATTPIEMKPVHLIPSIAVVAEGDYLSPESPKLPRDRSRDRTNVRGRRRSSLAAINTTPVTFIKPDVSKQKLVWLHVPFNNPAWVRDVLTTISVDKGKDCHSKLLNAEHWESKHVRGRHAEHHACFLKPACSVIGVDITSPIASPRQYFGKVPAELQMYLYLPYLHFDTYKQIVRRRTLIKRRIKQGRSRPVPQSIAKLDSLEFKTIWQYLGHDPPINCRRTLDQFGYPSLLDTRARDDDQMLYKMTKQRFAHHDDIFSGSAEEKQRLAEILKEAEELNSSSSSNSSSIDSDEELEGFEDEEQSEADENEDDILDGKVLMVDQLWLWIVDTETTVSFFPKRDDTGIDGRLFQQADLRNSIFNEVNADLTSRCENSFDLAALIALHAVTVLFERSSHPDLEIFRTFEEAISILTEKMTNSFKKFRARGFRDKADEHDEHLRAHNIRAKHKREGELAEKQNRENTSALLELRDIEDELHTLEELFDAQRDEILTMIQIYKREDLRDLTANGLLFLNQAEDYLSDYKRHVQRMIDDVRATREDFDKLLQMVQRQAQVDEVRLQRLQADLASAQSRSVMIFTVFTVIFLPLTFFCGLFGMNTREWGGGDFLTLRTIGLITLPTSFFIILLTCIIAWSSRMRKATNYTYRRIIRLSKSVRKSLTTFLYHIPAAATLASKDARKKLIEERRAARKQKKEEKKQASIFEEDFWESHVAARDKDYIVPPQNRKSVTFARKKAIEEMERTMSARWGLLGKTESNIHAYRGR